MINFIKKIIVWIIGFVTGALVMEGITMAAYAGDDDFREGFANMSNVFKE